MKINKKIINFMIIIIKINRKFIIIQKIIKNIINHIFNKISNINKQMMKIKY